MGTWLHPYKISDKNRKIYMKEAFDLRKVGLTWRKIAEELQKKYSAFGNDFKWFEAQAKVIVWVKRYCYEKEFPELANK